MLILSEQVDAAPDERLRVLVAGAGGVLGRLVVKELAARGHRVRAVVRRAREMDGVEVRRVYGLRGGAWAGVCDGIDVVVSSIGASVNPSPLVGWRPYTAVDAPVNIALLNEAQRAGVRRIVYVSLIDAESSRSLNYSEGHERVVDSIRESGMPAAIMRPTGFFAAMGELVRFAKRGGVPVIGDGRCMTNPIHEADLATATADAAVDSSGGVREVRLGGPEEFTRREIAALAFEAIGKKPRLVHVPRWVMEGMGHAMRVVNPRVGHFVLFAAHIMTHPCVAPRVGRRGIREYFAEVARG